MYSEVFDEEWHLDILNETDIFSIVAHRILFPIFSHFTILQVIARNTYKCDFFLYGIKFNHSLQMLFQLKKYLILLITSNNN